MKVIRVEVATDKEGGGGDVTRPRSRDHHVSQQGVGGGPRG